MQFAAQFHVQYRKLVALAVGLIAAECFKSEVPVNGLGRAVLFVYVNVDGTIPVGGSAYQLLAEPFPYVRRGYKQRFNLAILYADESCRRGSAIRNNQRLDCAQCRFLPGP